MVAHPSAGRRCSPHPPRRSGSQGNGPNTDRSLRGSAGFCSGPCSRRRHAAVSARFRRCRSCERAYPAAAAAAASVEGRGSVVTHLPNRIPALATRDRSFGTATRRAGGAAGDGGGGHATLRRAGRAVHIDELAGRRELRCCPQARSAPSSSAACRERDLDLVVGRSPAPRRARAARASASRCRRSGSPRPRWSPEAEDRPS